MSAWSHLTWVRGLKLNVSHYAGIEVCVAPYVGAWIETQEVIGLGPSGSVAPYVGAWIETNKTLTFAIQENEVAPYVGAWLATFIA